MRLRMRMCDIHNKTKGNSNNNSHTESVQRAISFCSIRTHKHQTHLETKVKHHEWRWNWMGNTAWLMTNVAKFRQRRGQADIFRKQFFVIETCGSNQGERWHRKENSDKWSCLYCRTRLNCFNREWREWKRVVWHIGGIRTNGKCLN